MGYMLGLRVPKDDALAVAWLRKAAEQNDTSAQGSLRSMLMTGRVVPVIDTDAGPWWRAFAAEAATDATAFAQQRGDAERDDAGADAQYKLGQMYGTGRGVALDYAQAAAWYRKAAERGHPGAQTDLGGLYAGGHGVPADAAEALRWYRMAAAQGFADAEDRLGDLYAKGQSVPQDDAQALAFYRAAAGQDFAAAECKLGLLYEDGTGGVEKDPVEAKHLLARAEQHGGLRAQACLLGRQLRTLRAVAPPSPSPDR
jgi:TPR repeat protein